MKVVHISNTDSGGAIELHAAMLENGIDSTMLVAKHDLGYARNIYLVGGSDKIRSVFSNIVSSKLFRNINKTRGMYSYPLTGAGLSKHKMVRAADVIYLHFVAHSSLLSLNEIERILKLGKPVVFITRDMWPITGGCHSFLNCERYTTHCFPCPVFNEKNQILKFSKLQQKSKLRIYNKYSNLFFIGISNWTMDAIRKASVSNKSSVITIHNCIDTTIFKPVSKSEARKILNLPQNEILIGFGARDVNNPLKGGSYLKEALSKIKSTENLIFSIVTFGTNNSEISFIDNVPQYNLGQLKDRCSMALFYNAVDVYVNPTLAEAFGNTAAESLACGTPVVGFKVGGLIDIVDHDLNGYLANEEDVNDLIKGILSELNNKHINQDVSLKCRDAALRKFSRKIIMEKHLGLINSLLEKTFIK